MNPSELLKQHFHHDTFRPGQEQVIETLLEGRSALAVFPTGGGKSLCYQLPALTFEGLTLVVSPLREIYDRMFRGELKLVYVAPERLGNEGFLKRLKKCSISLLAIDEAHCISEWGHNFRPDYLKLAELAREIRAERVSRLASSLPRHC